MAAEAEVWTMAKIFLKNPLAPYLGLALKAKSYGVF